MLPVGSAFSNLTEVSHAHLGHEVRETTTGFFRLPFLIVPILNGAPLTMYLELMFYSTWTRTDAEVEKGKSLKETR